MSKVDEGPPVKKTKNEEDDRQSLDVELFAAASLNNLADVERLLAEGADATFQEDESGRSVLMEAAANGNCEMIKVLLKDGAVWNALDRKHKCAGDYAVEGKHQVRKKADLSHFS